MLPLTRPTVSHHEVVDGIRGILESGTLTNGPWVERFEAAVAQRVGTRYAVATTSATTALHLALCALGVAPGDEVLVSDFTFPATGNVLVQLGAVPVLVDCAPGSFALDLDEAAARVTTRTTALVPVDPFGQPADLAGVRSLAATRGLAVVEDAACALGSAFEGRECGSWPDAGCFSFHPRKILTTGEGGMVTTDDEGLAISMRELRNHGASPPAPGRVGSRFTRNGFNYRLAEIPALIGVVQMARLDEVLEDRAGTAATYANLLTDIPGVTATWPGPLETWNYQSLVVMLDDEIDRDAVVRWLAAEAIESTLGTYAMHAQPAFERFGYTPGDLPHSWRAQRQSLTLPLPPGMSANTIEHVADVLAAGISAVT